VPNSGRDLRFSHAFLKQLFARGVVYEELFNKVVKAGCEAETLSVLLFAVCTIADADRRGFFDPGDISTPQLKRLRRDLLLLADLVERVNRTRLNPKLDLLAAPPDAGRDPIRKHVAKLYDHLPSIMRAYSFHLERFAKFSRAVLKRLTFLHFQTIDLLLYVEENTGNPRYEDMSDLLTAGFLVAGGAEEDIPEFFSADALAKLKQRTAKLRMSARVIPNPPKRPD
jgi:hypothetical protein